MTGDSSTDHYIDVAEKTTVSDGRLTVTVRRILTPKGERVEVSSPDDAIRIDALGLESLSWQDQDVIEEFVNDAEVAGRVETADDDGELTCEFAISNEYADVIVRKLETAAGERLLVEAPKKQFSLRFTPVGLAGLAAQETSIFSEFLETPHGPGGHAH